MTHKNPLKTCKIFPVILTLFICLPKPVILESWFGQKGFVENSRRCSRLHLRNMSDLFFLPCHTYFQIRHSSDSDHENSNGPYTLRNVSSAIIPHNSLLSDSALGIFFCSE